MNNDDDVMPGAEPFHFVGNEVGVLVCHGFTGTTQSLRYLGEQLHGAGYTVIGPRLKGHGTTPEAMARTTAADWIASVDEALDELRKTCTQIFVTGLSMGGTLTLFTAASHADVIKGAIPINAVVQSGNPDLAGLAFGRGLPDAVPGIGSDVKDPESKELAYPVVPVASVKEVYALAAVTHDLLPRIKCPTLIFTSREDHVVDPRNAARIAGALGASRIEMVWLENSYHVATIDHDKALIAQQTIAFIESVVEH